ncbi:phosphatidate cytidylyltransferase [Caenispirillum salinarum]|uniref:phosphatidate cytidylyltransferase n=1 Tax=Caenispirillum salinarum TaxID=859058 RepID=UPI0038512D1A
MLKTRVLSALIMVPVALACAWAGSPVFDIAIAAVAVIMAHEWQAIVQAGWRAPGWASGAASAAAALLAVPAPEAALALIAGAVPLVWLLARSRDGAGWAALGVLYVALPAMTLVWLREHGGLATLIWIFVIVWVTDTGGYVFGKNIGGPKLSPRISPNKTWAGLLGGAFSAMVAGAAVAFLVNPTAALALILFSGGLAIVEQMSDLTESYVKRRFGVKDSGHIIPGHGGVLDRVDGLVLTAPVVALATYLAQGGITAW